MKRHLCIVALATALFAIALPAGAADETSPPANSKTTSSTQGIVGVNSSWVGSWTGRYKAVTFDGTMSMRIFIKSVDETGKANIVLGMYQNSRSCGGEFSGTGVIQGEDITIKTAPGELSWCKERVVEAKRNGDAMTGRLKMVDAPWTTFTVSR